MSEENEQITEESVGAQPAAENPADDQPEPQAAPEAPKAGKLRKKGRRAAEPEPETEDPIAAARDESETPVAEEGSEEPVSEAGSEVLPENPAADSELPPDAAEESPQPESPAEPAKGRKSRKKGKRSGGPVVGESSTEEEPPASEESAPREGESVEEGSPEEGESQEAVEPADEGTRHALPMVIEAILFASQKPMSAKELISVFKGAAEAVKEVPDAPARAFAKIKEPHLRDAIESLEIACAAPDRAYEVRESAAGWQLVTKPQYSPWLRQLFPEHRSARLSAPAMETLAIIAYRQPITRADIEAVRGVAVDGVMQTLLDRGLVKIAGRADVPGRPLLYDTTQNFMEHFGLKNLDDLPNAAELRKISLPTAEPPPADPPAAAETPASTQNQAPAEAVSEASAQPAVEDPAEVPSESSGAPVEEASAEGAATPEPATETAIETAETAADEEASPGETSEAPAEEGSVAEISDDPPAEPEPEIEIAETPISPDASEEESRTEN